MHRSITIVLFLLLFATVACEKVDQAIDAVDKAKAIKTDIEKKADEVKKDLMSKADKVSQGILKDMDKLQTREKENASGEEKEGKEKGDRNGKDD